MGWKRGVHAPRGLCPFRLCQKTPVIFIIVGTKPVLRAEPDSGQASIVILRATLGEAEGSTKKMNWDAIGALGEIIGAIAVIVTLIYLTIQVRESARASRAAAVTDATASVQAWYQEIGSNPESAKLFLEGMTNPDALPVARQFQFLMLVHSIFLGFQRTYFLSQAGTLDAGLRDSIGTAIHAVNHLPGIHLYWRVRRAFFQPEFVSWVEELLKREPLTDMAAYLQNNQDAPA